ncbi:MAG: hypothetical protein OHK0015_53070 [Chloroflexi bacterium OHK40]
MRYTAAEQQEFDIDDLLAVSLPTEVTDTVLVHVSEPEYDMLRADHRTAWRVVTGPITDCIVVILSLGPSHIAWCVNDDEAAHIARLLRTRQPLLLTVSSPRRRFDVNVPPLPIELCAYLQLDYIPVSAA